jgi:hypothetical protein
MGTSSSYPGPGRNTPLLPPWADDDGNEEPQPLSPDRQPANGSPLDPLPDQNQPGNIPIVPTVNLMPARRHFGKYATGGGGSSLRQGARSYVRGMGGARNAARASRAGKNATRRLGGFLVDVATRGMQDALEALQLRSTIGRPVEEVLATITNILAPSGTSLDEAAARAAMSETLGELYTQYGLEDGDLSNLEAMGADEIRIALQLSVTNYIYEKLLNVMQSSLDEHNMSDYDLLKAEREIKLFIRETVHLELENIDVMIVDWNGKL